MHDELLYQVALGMTPGIGGITAKKLISYCGGAENVFKEKHKALKKIPGIGEGISKAVNNKLVLERAEKELAFIQKHDIRALYFLHKDYPYRLKQCDDGPIVLFVKGQVDLNQPKVVSVVGTRSITDYGRKKCKELIEGLKAHKALIVSGLAYGVDTCAHKMALECGLETIAILGHGLDRIYPQSNKNLAKQIAKQGGLVTDFVSATNPDRENFPKRNRIIAGICDAVVVVEAAVTGGALITATIANSYSRDVFALPGRTSDPYSMGCNKLIKIHKANLLESVADLEYIMNWETSPKETSPIKSLFVQLDQEEEHIVDILKTHPGAGIDAIVHESGYTMGKTSALLLNLEFKDVVAQLPGKCFKIHEAFAG
jgi:DNA processing protein